MPKISYDEYLRKVRDPDIDDDEVLFYSIVVRGEGAFDYELRADPAKVQMSDSDRAFESAVNIGNGISRFRRQTRFRRRLRNGSDLPVLVSEGDSWFQFPFLIKEVIDQLGDDYLIWSVGAGGDTVQNMVRGERRRGQTEYMAALKEQKDRVRGFLFSAAGNDIIGEDTETGIAALSQLIKPFNGDNTDIVGHIDTDLVAEKMEFLRAAYETVIDTIRSEPQFQSLPIFIHGYDYVFPYPWGADDPRDPIHASKNEWIGEPLDQRGIHDPDLRRNILINLIDRLHDMLSDLAGDPAVSHVWLVDCRGAMPDVADWVDEIHGTSAGFKKVARKFKPVIDNAIAIQTA